MVVPPRGRPALVASLMMSRAVTVATPPNGRRSYRASRVQQQLQRIGITHQLLGLLDELCVAGLEHISHRDTGLEEFLSDLVE